MIDHSFLDPDPDHCHNWREIEFAIWMKLVCTQFQIMIY